VLRVVRVVVNSFAGCLLLLLAWALWWYNPVISILLALASLDQFEDVYYYVYRRRLIPQWLMPVDVVFEGVAVSIGLGMLLMAILYMSYFQTWFFQALLIASIFVVWSGLEDIIQWSAYVRAGREVTACALRPPEGRFVRRRR